MDIIEAKTTWGRWLKAILLCLLALTPAVPVLIWLGYRRLKNIPEDDPNYKALKYSLYLGLIYVFIVGGYVIWFFARTSEGENETWREARIDRIPQSSCNISYHRSWNLDVHEFTVSEEEFVKSCTKRKDLQEIKEFKDGRRIERYAKYMGDKPEEEHYATATDGLYYEWINDDSRIFKVMYDRQKQRAYIFSRKIVED